MAYFIYILLLHNHSVYLSIALQYNNIHIGLLLKLYKGDNTNLDVLYGYITPSYHSGNSIHYIIISFDT